MSKYNAIIVGLGAMGSAALHQLTELNPNKKYLGIEKYKPGHAFGSSHGRARIARLATAEGIEYMPYVQRTLDLTQSISKKTSIQLLTQSHGLVIGEGQDKNSFMSKSHQLAEQHNIGYKIYSCTKDFKKLYPQLKVNDNHMAYYEHETSMINPTQLITTQLKLAEQNGADIHTEESLLNYKENHNGDLMVKTNKCEYVTDKLILTMGPWYNDVLAEQYTKNFNLEPAILYTFKVDTDYQVLYNSNNCPAILWDVGEENIIVLYPVCDKLSPTIQMGVYARSEALENNLTINDIHKQVTNNTIMKNYENFIKPYFNGISNRCLEARAYPLAKPADDKIKIDFHPEYEQKVVIVVSCSHAFKCSVAIGEELAKVALDQSQKVINDFGNYFERFKNV